MMESTDGNGVGSIVEDFIVKGADAAAKILGARSQAQVAQAQYTAQVAQAQAQTKTYLYVGIGLFLAAMAFRYIRSRG